MPTLVPELADQCVVLNGVAKTYAMTGWRVGWMIGPADVDQGGHQPPVARHVERGQRVAGGGAGRGDRRPRRRWPRCARPSTAGAGRMHALLTGIDGVTVLEPQGAFYAFPNLHGATSGATIRGRWRRDHARAVRRPARGGQGGDRAGRGVRRPRLRPPVVRPGRRRPRRGLPAHRRPARRAAECRRGPSWSPRGPAAAGTSRPACRRRTGPGRRRSRPSWWCGPRPAWAASPSTATTCGGPRRARPRAGASSSSAGRPGTGAQSTSCPRAPTPAPRVHEYGGGAWQVARRARSGTPTGPTSGCTASPPRPPRSPSRPPVTPEPRRPGAPLGRRRPRRRRPLARLRARAPRTRRHAGRRWSTSSWSSTPPASCRPGRSVSGPDFVSDPRLSPDGTRCRWLQWDHPDMPWDGTELGRRPTCAGRRMAPACMHLEVMAGRHDAGAAAPASRCPAPLGARRLAVVRVRPHRLVEPVPLVPTPTALGARQRRGRWRRWTPSRRAPVGVRPVGATPSCRRPGGLRLPSATASTTWPCATPTASRPTSTCPTPR